MTNMTPEEVIAGFQPTVDPLWAKPCLAYNLQIPFDRETSQKLRKVQASIAKQRVDALYQCPPETLHVTVYALVPVRERFDKERYWNTVAEKTITTLTRCSHRMRPFTLRFSRIAVSRSAIIAVAAQNKTIARIRQSLRETIPPPPKSPPHLDSIHCTLFRFQSAAALPLSVIGDIESTPLKVSLPVSAMSLRREIVYPSLKSELIATFNLAARRKPHGSS
jgi:hypothetical protein